MKAEKIPYEKYRHRVQRRLPIYAQMVFSGDRSSQMERDFSKVCRWANDPEFLYKDRENWRVDFMIFEIAFSDLARDCYTKISKVKK